MLKRIFTLAVLAAVSALCAFAQSTNTYTVDVNGAFDCSYAPNTPYCYGLPIKDDSTGAQGQIFMLSQNMTFMGGYEGLGEAIYTSINATNLTGTGTGTATYGFEDAATEGSQYTGVLTLNYQWYLCGRWHTQHCWQVTSGTATIITQ